MLYLVPLVIKRRFYFGVKEEKKKGSASERIFGQCAKKFAGLYSDTRIHGYVQTGGSVNNLSLVCAAVSATDIISSGPEAEMPPNSPLFRRCNYLTYPPPSSLSDHPLPTRRCAIHTHSHTCGFGINLAWLGNSLRAVPFNQEPVRLIT